MDASCNYALKMYLLLKKYCQVCLGFLYDVTKMQPCAGHRYSRSFSKSSVFHLSWWKVLPNTKPSIHSSNMPYIRGNWILQKWIPQILEDAAQNLAYRNLMTWASRQVIFDPSVAFHTPRQLQMNNTVHARVQTSENLPKIRYKRAVQWNRRGRTLFY